MCWTIQQVTYSLMHILIIVIENNFLISTLSRFQLLLLNRQKLSGNKKNETTSILTVSIKSIFRCPDQISENKQNLK